MEPKIALAGLRIESRPVDGEKERRVTATVTFFEPTDDPVIEFIAPAPSHRNGSFSGSGLPFANAEQAFYETPNAGKVNLTALRTAEIPLKGMPGSFYTGLGTVLVPPTLVVTYRSGGVQKTESVVLAHSIPFRTGTYPNARKAASGGFYDKTFPLARSQEQILYESAYPCPAAGVSRATEPADFWGGKPPL